MICYNEKIAITFLVVNFKKCKINIANFCVVSTDSLIFINIRTDWSYGEVKWFVVLNKQITDMDISTIITHLEGVE